MFWVFQDAISVHAKAITPNHTWSCTEICTNGLRWLIRSIIQQLETWQIALKKCKTGPPPTFICPGAFKGWWTRCMYRTSWFSTRLHCCLFNLLTYLLWSSASTVLAADDKDGEGGIEFVRKRPPECLEGPPTDISSISSNSFFSNKRAEADPGGLEEHRLFNHSSSK